MREQVLVFLLAGHETTSTALTFTLRLLGLHPEIQQRVRDEIRAVVGDREPTAADVRELSYTTMALKEAMRLESVIALACLVRDYEFTSLPGEIPVEVHITLRPKVPVPIQIRPTH